MKDLLKYLKNYKKELIFGPFFKLLEAIFELIVPIVMAKIIDNGIGRNDSSYIFRMSGLIVLLSFARHYISISISFPTAILIK